MLFSFYLDLGQNLVIWLWLYM